MHKNVIAVTAGVNGFVDFYPKSDVYISYLPLAHILALVVHLAMIGFGVPVGFGVSVSNTFILEISVLMLTRASPLVL